MDLKQAVLSVGISIISSIVTSIVTIGFGFKYFTRQKWWEKRAEAYQNVVEALSKKEAYLVRFIEDLEVGSEWTQFRRESFESANSDAQKKIELLVHSDAYLLSYKAINVLKAFQQDLQKSVSNDDINEAVSAHSEITKKALEEITKQAKVDLGIK